MSLLEQMPCFQHVPPHLAQNVLLRIPHHCVPNTGTVRWVESGGVGTGGDPLGGMSFQYCCIEMLVSRLYGGLTGLWTRAELGEVRYGLLHHPLYG